MREMCDIYPQSLQFIISYNEALFSLKVPAGTISS